MSATLLDGKILATKIKEELKKEVFELRKRTKAIPSLMNLMIGSSSDSRAYADSQKKCAEYIGIHYDLVNLPEGSTQKDFLKTIDKLNSDHGVHGILLHKPVPKHIDYAEAINRVNAVKDIEGLNVVNMGKLMLGEIAIVPCTCAAVMEHIHSTGVNLRGKEAVVIGRSEIVGKPVSLLLLKESATVTVCHSGTHEAGRLQEHVGRADILVVAIGKAKSVKGEWIKKGAIVIDVGINKVGSQIIGDVEFVTAQKKASFITPVPGGVGPVTVIMLMRNVLNAFKLQMKG